MTQANCTMPLTSQAANFIDSVLRLSPRIAIFDCDGTLWAGDSGERFMNWEIERKVVPEKVAAWISQRYRDYKAGKVSEEDICGEMVTMNDGVEVARLEREAEEYFAAQFAQAIFPDMRELVSQLHQSGCAVWACSSTNEWVVQAGARYFDIPADRVLAATVACDRGIASGRLLRVPTDDDKAVAIREVIGAAADAVFGNSMHDAAMLAVAAHAFAVNPNEDLQQLARQRGWNVYFPMGTTAR
jgi:phosphoserine phosphatase